MHNAGGAESKQARPACPVLRNLWKKREWTHGDWRSNSYLIAYKAMLGGPIRVGTSSVRQMEQKLRKVLGTKSWGGLDLISLAGRGLLGFDIQLGRGGGGGIKGRGRRG